MQQKPTIITYFKKHRSYSSQKAIARPIFISFLKNYVCFHLQLSQMWSKFADTSKQKHFYEAICHYHYQHYYYGAH